ncbi:MAG: HIT domain-containing protein [Chloroflexota bacterium]|nr:HIT domain-containing protein [Dehalococcoidia bacterium]MDW8255162.1 HIT domain-containing protein [Chloroflexota bacterium]
MERLWTPWRFAYVTAEAPKSCVLCEKWASDQDRDNLVLLRGERAFILLNLFPYNPGHLMVAPVAHIASLPALDPAARAEMFELASLATDVLSQVMKPNGFNLGMNLGRSAGAGIADHLHLHVVPRWEGDTNFMPLLANTRVLPETLPQTYDRLRPAFEAARR